VRITFVAPPVDMSGGSRVIALHADGLRRRGHEVVVVSVAQFRPTFRDYVRSLVKWRPWPEVPKQGPSHFDNLGVDLRRLPHSGPVTDADVPDADVVLATWCATAPWVAGLSPSKGARGHFMQGYETFAGAPGEIDGFYGLPLPKIVISNWLRDVLRDHFQQTAVAVVHNSVDPQEFYAPPRGRQAVPTVGLNYGNSHHKGCDISLAAVRRALQELPKLRLVGMSNAPLDDNVPPNAVITHQARGAQLREIYSQCDAWLFSSRAEGFGLPILEAMACRTPVLATPAGAAPELVGQGGGLLVPHEDPEALAKAIVKVCILPDDEWRSLSDRALATAVGYSWDDATAAFEKAVQEIAAKK
jgi:glycosyltransferase involved in cell wall biosynthesis